MRNGHRSVTTYESILLFKIWDVPSHHHQYHRRHPLLVAPADFVYSALPLVGFQLTKVSFSVTVEFVFSLSELTFSFDSITIGLQSCRQQHFNVKISSWDDNVCYVTLIDFLRL